MADPFVLVDPGVLDGATAGQAVALPEDADKHLRTVLRLDVGAPVVLADGDGATAPATLTEDAARLVADAEIASDPRPSLHVLQGLAKGRKVDDVVRTLTELGVERITPVAAERSVVKLVGPKADKAVQRWRAVARAASEQSRRARAPRIDEPGSVAEIVDDLAGAHLVVAHVGATVPLADALPAPGAAPDRLVLAVGPEGGWTEGELESFVAAGARVASLGRAVLRTEHAAPALAAISAFALGRMV